MGATLTAVFVRGREAWIAEVGDSRAYLLRNERLRQITRDQSLEQVWGDDFFGGSRTVDVHTRWLREKLEDAPSRPKHLLTVRGVGYKFVR